MLGTHGKHCDCTFCGTCKSVGLMNDCDGKNCKHPIHRKHTALKSKKKKR